MRKLSTLFIIILVFFILAGCADKPHEHTFEENGRLMIPITGTLQHVNTKKKKRIIRTRNNKRNNKGTY